MLSDKSAFYDTLTSKQQRALDGLQALLYTNSGITPDEAARTQTLLEILDQK